MNQPTLPPRLEAAVEYRRRLDALLAEGFAESDARDELARMARATLNGRTAWVGFRPGRETIETFLEMAEGAGASRPPSLEEQLRRSLK